MITGEILIKGLFYFILKAKGGKYLSRKEVINKKTGKKSYQYTYAPKKGEKPKAPQEQPKPVKQSTPKKVKESKPKADKKSMKDKKQFNTFGEFLASDPIPNAAVQTNKEMPTDSKEKFTHTIDLENSKIFTSSGFLQTGNIIGSAAPLVKQNPNQGIFYLKSKDGKDVGAIKHDKDSNRYYYFSPGQNTMFKDEGEVISKDYFKEPSSKNMKIEEMPLDDLISLYKEIKNKKGDKPDKVYNLIVQKDMENTAKPYKDKAAEYMSNNDVKEGDTIDGIKIGKGRNGYYATANEEYSGTPSMKQVQGMKSLKQAVAVAMAIKDSDNGWIKGKAERKPLSEVAHYFE